MSEKKDEKKVATRVKVTSLDVFKTRRVSNEGVWVDLKLPSGELTDAQLHILGVDSDRFRDAVDKAAREGVANAAREDLSKEEKEALELQGRRETAATLVDAWRTVDGPTQPLTVAQVLDLFDESPFVQDLVDSFAAKRSRFFEARSSSSSNTSSTDPCSTDSPTDQPAQTPTT